MAPQNLVYGRRGRAQWSTRYIPHQNGRSYKAHNIALAFAEVKMIMGTKKKEENESQNWEIFVGSDAETHFEWKEIKNRHYYDKVGTYKSALTLN